MDVTVELSLDETSRNAQKCSIESDPLIKSELIENDKIFDMELKYVIKDHKTELQGTDEVTKEEVATANKEFENESNDDKEQSKKNQMN